MKRIRIVSDGHSWGTCIYDPDGKEIKARCKSIEIKAGLATTAVLHIHSPEVDVQAWARCSVSWRKRFQLAIRLLLDGFCEKPPRKGRT